MLFELTEVFKSHEITNYLTNKPVKITYLYDYL